MAHHTRAQTKPAKTPKMQAFENELRANIEKLRPGVRFISIRRDDSDGKAWVTLHDGKFRPLKLEAPVGQKSGPYTETILAAYDAQLLVQQLVDEELVKSSEP